MLILVTIVAWSTRFETRATASRQAHRWLRRKAAVAGDWATILDAATGAVRSRYVRHDDGSVRRMQ